MDVPKGERPSIGQPLGGGLFGNSAELLAVVVDHALAAVVTMDDRGIITGWGRRAQEQFGWPPDEAIGQELVNLIVPPQYRDAHTRGLAQYRKTGEGPVLGRVVELSALHRSGREFPVELAISRAAKVAGITTFIAFVRDITERKEAEQRQADLYLQATRATESIRDFSNLAVHELRAPLSVAKGYAEMLLEGSFGVLPGPLSEPLRLIGEKLGVAERLIGDLLMTARVDSGGVPVARDVVNLVVLASDAADKARSRAELAGGSIKVEAREPVVSVPADYELSSAVVNNLINNAISYGGDPPLVTVSVAGSPQPSIAVTDLGPGVPADMSERIFERFVRGERGRNTPGSGLGLYLSRRLAELQGGSLTLERSSPGSGSTFRLQFPGDPADLSA
ncbi:MAG: PAS domain-containing sensor histidine kinase [Candidatus Dormibacteraeota bacterium]|nr:PAS domain-containing sensor histidine kinase [Candidatus Dormibacteraeota bacterium]